ncbi:MAG: glycosyltransferase [Candidatus Komeilibacteria bacterium]|nr:glycosyltransferase [Candidatus Komeilibacteria bacterium]
MDKPQPLISFIIPVFNEEKHLLETINPLNGLTWLDKEIIVADGGSTDNTMAIARQLADKVYVRASGEKNKSIAENRNKGASLASGKYLFFLDCGVKIGKLDEFVKKVLETMEQSPKNVGLTLEIRFYPSQENDVDRFNLWVINKTITNLNKIKLGMAFGWVQVVRGEAFKQIGGYNETLITSEDADLFKRLSKLGRTICLKDFIAYGSAIRYHTEGWPKIIGLALVNFVSYIFRKKSYSKEWKKIN